MFGNPSPKLACELFILACSNPFCGFIPRHSTHVQLMSQCVLRLSLIHWLRHSGLHAAITCSASAILCMASCDSRLTSGESISVLDNRSAWIRTAKAALTSLTATVNDSGLFCSCVKSSRASMRSGCIVDRVHPARLKPQTMINGKQAFLIMTRSADYHLPRSLFGPFIHARSFKHAQGEGGSISAIKCCTNSMSGGESRQSYNSVGFVLWDMGWSNLPIKRLATSLMINIECKAH